MAQDARFEDGTERPLHLKAQEVEDLPVMSALVQDSVLAITDMTWQPKSRRLAFLINRFRWEDRAAAEARRRPYERVRSLLVIDSVTGVASQGIDRTDKDAILSILVLEWKAGSDGAGRIELVLAGDGAIAADVECLDVTLKDVTRPYIAPSRKVPGHPE